MGYLLRDLPLCFELCLRKVGVEPTTYGLESGVEPTTYGLESRPMVWRPCSGALFLRARGREVALKPRPGRGRGSSPVLLIPRK
jgi:hypothetical protein